ncbi:MAG: 1-deoxy-D-xylulose-5-phosphate synthase, partial [Armatimonadota bacterium]|nr:1-deoxy-D-xylulose-5-phosphate synthase [Armatimonadota bacterium]
YGLEDVAVMRVQPGIAVVAPADHQQARSAILATWDLPGPVYYRLGKDDKTVVPGLDGRFEIGQVQQIGEGSDLLLITMGNISSETVAASQVLAAQGIACTVLVVASLNPAPIDDLARFVARFSLALSVEAHYVNGGVGSLVAEVIAEHGLGCRLVRCGVKTLPNGVTGSQQYMQHEYGISRAAVVETALQALHDEVSE